MTTYTPKYLLATQSGKEAFINENFQSIAATLASLAASIVQGGGSTITAEQLQALFIDQTELSAILTAALSGIQSSGGGVSLAEVQAALSQLQTSLLASIQAELNSRPVPATVTDVQNAVAGINGGATGLSATMVQMFYGVTLPMGFHRVTPVRDFSRSRVNGGPALPTVSTAAGAPASVELDGLVYSVDSVRGFYSYNVNTGDVVTLASPPMAPFSTSQRPLLAETFVLGAELLCVVSDTLNTSFSYFNVGTGIWSEKVSIVSGLSLSTLVQGATGILGIGGSASTGYVAILFAGNTATDYYCTGGWPSSYHAPALSCRLGDGSTLVAMRPSAAASHAQSYVLSIDGTNLSLLPTTNGLPAEVLNVVSLHQTSYGAAAVVTLNNTAAPYQYAIAQFSYADGTWTLLPDRLGSTAMSASAALAVLDTDLAVLTFGPSNSGPAAYLVKLTAQDVPELYYAAKL